jgi:NAD(P)-dependent dehydrogenase (short-subunit alcohol dehydrogenase family)
MPRVFFITGTSTGFGNFLVQEVLDKGDIAVATARKPESLSFKGTSEKVCRHSLTSEAFPKRIEFSCRQT